MLCSYSSENSLSKGPWKTRSWGLYPVGSSGRALVWTKMASLYYNVHESVKTTQWPWVSWAHRLQTQEAPGSQGQTRSWPENLRVREELKTQDRWNRDSRGLGKGGQGSVVTVIPSHIDFHFPVPPFLTQAHLQRQPPPMHRTAHNENIDIDHIHIHLHATHRKAPCRKALFLHTWHKLLCAHLAIPANTCAPHSKFPKLPLCADTFPDKRP